MSESISLKHVESFMQDDSAPLTLIYKSANLGMSDIEYPDMQAVDSGMALSHIDKVVTFHDKTLLLLSYVFSDVSIAYLKPEDIRKSGFTQMFLCGFFDLMLKYSDMDKQVVLKHPENGLHPSVLIRLADILIEMMDYPDVNWYNLDMKIQKDV